jgi:hypothetical protein
MRAEEFGKAQIKACHLALDFRGKGFVRVMQSARYFVAHSMDQAIAELHKEADMYTELIAEVYKNGELNIEEDGKFQVVREKLETLASSHGVPVSDQDAANFNKYFEFHIRLSRKDETDITPVSDEEVAELQAISQEFTERFGVPVPLSYNKTNEHQRFLNVRFRKTGSHNAREFVQQIVDAINSSVSFKWVKTISEYVPYDSFTSLDEGWIDFPSNVAVSSTN